MEAKVSWRGGLQFTGSADSGHVLAMDGPVPAGGGNSAPRPSELLLLGLAGCAGMDVISILKKKRQPVSGLEISITAQQREAHPARFTHFEVKYRVYGEGVDPEAVRRSIELSEEKYCIVGATLREGISMASEFEILAGGRSD